LFAELLNKAEQNSLIVYWGVKGFSIRVPWSNANPISILYGFPAGTNGRPAPYLQGYVRDILSKEERDQVRAKLLTIRGFRAGGEYTAELLITDEEAVKSGEAAIEIMLRVAKAMLNQQMG
jgi:hypothetical protein